MRNEERQTICLSIDRRSTLAAFVVFVAAHAAPLQLYGISLAVGVVQWYLFSMPIHQLQLQWEQLQAESSDLERQMREMKREMKTLIPKEL